MSPLVDRVGADTPPDQSVLVGVQEELRDPGRKLGMVVFDHERVVALALDDLIGDRLLTSCCVDRHYRRLDLDFVQEFRNYRDFVRFLGGGHLPQANTALHRPGTDQEQRPQAIFGSCDRRSAFPSMATTSTFD